MSSSISFGNANAGIQANIINGNVDATFHQAPERPETPPPPSIVIPFARDVDFVERGTILERVCQKCAVSGSRVALVGLGGVGKSQLAIEHAYRTHEQSPETWVFWVHASNAARFEQSYRDIADRVKILGRRGPQANIFKLVHDWLCNCTQRWLIVLDNVDDARFLLNTQATDSKTVSQPLREFLPYCERSSVLITSRNKEAAQRLVEQRDIILVEPMEKAEGQALFEKKLGAQEDSDCVVKLAAALDYMPLAIVQAAAYISQRTPRYSLTRYLDEYTRSERKQTGLLNYEGGQLRRDWEANNSIIITWQISFEHIQQTRQSAANLLSLMSFFDRQGIPEALLRNRTKHRNTIKSHNERGNNDWDNHRNDGMSQSSASDDEGEFEDDVLALQKFCFISVNTSGTSFEMHALVQLATRKWLKANGKFEQWNERFISNLCAEYPTGDYENWTICELLFAHAKSAAGRQPKSELSLVEWATLLYHAAWYAYEKGNAPEAEELAVKSMKARQSTLGLAHKDTLSSMGMVGLAYKIGGQWQKAASIERERTEASRKVLGVDHPNTLTSISNLASTYWTQGRWDAAEELFVEVIETSKKKLGADHPSTLASMNNLASTYRNQGRWDAAEELEVQVMETRKKKQGADYPDTLASMNNLAYTQKALGREVEAIKLMRECVQLWQQRFRPNHPNLLSSLATLAHWEAELAAASREIV